MLLTKTKGSSSSEGKSFLFEHVCRRCKETKPVAEFQKDSSKRLGIKNVCKPCNRAEAAEYASTRRGEYSARAKAWYQQNKERKQEYDRAWRKGYVKRKREELLAKVNARRRRVRGAQPAWANKFFIQEAYRLAQLRSAVTGIKWSVDHIVPITHALVCGLHCEANLRVIPETENKRKNNRWWPNMP